MVLASDPHLRLWDTYPLHLGHVKALEYVPKQQRAAYEAQWREWAKQHPKSDWPEWLREWPETKKRLEAAGR